MVLLNEQKNKPVHWLHRLHPCTTCHVPEITAVHQARTTRAPLVLSHLRAFGRYLGGTADSSGMSMGIKCGMGAGHHATVTFAKVHHDELLRIKVSWVVIAKLPLRRLRAHSQSR